MIVLAGCGPFVDFENVQSQVDETAGLLGDGGMVGQQFVARCAGLSAVDVLVAIDPDAARANGWLTLELDEIAPDSIRRVATGRYREATLDPNQWLSLNFSPDVASDGHVFVLSVHSSDPATEPVTVWATSHLGPPERVRTANGTPISGSLVFRTWCDPPPLHVALETWTALRRDGELWPLELALCLVPGLAAALLLRPHETDLAALAGEGVGWSALVAPLALAAGSPVRGGPPAVALVSVLGVAFLISRLAPPILRRVAHGGDGPQARPRALRLTGPAAVAFIATVGAFCIRAITARNLILPMWVDSVQHSYIVQLILDSGGVPMTYGPLVPSEAFDYHFGFHALAATGAWLTGASPSEAVLVTGQALNTLVCLAVYRLARDLTDSPRAAAIGALLVGLVTTQPTYFVTWGRYPELAGLAALPAAFGALRGVLGKHWEPRTIATAVIAAAALILVHPRVAVFCFCLVGATGLVEAVRQREPLAVLHWIGRGATVGILSLVVIAPWVARLWGAHQAQTFGPLNWQPIDFPIGLATAGNDRWLLGLALVGAALGLVRGARVAWITVGWATLVLMAANPATFHLPVQFWVDNNSVAIATFVPVAVLVGYTFASLAEFVRLSRWPTAGRCAVTGLVVLGAASQAPSLVGVVNPCCQLAGAADVAAFRWIDQHTAESAKFIINGYRWQGTAWAGTDAGYWLPVLARRSTNLPPLFYENGPTEGVRQVDAQAEEISRSASNPTAIALLARRIGAQYVFVGTRGGALDPGALTRSGLFRIAYGQGGAWVLELDHQ